MFFPTDKLTEENKTEMPFTLSLHSTLGVKIYCNYKRKLPTKEGVIIKKKQKLYFWY